MYLHPCAQTYPPLCANVAHFHLRKRTASSRAKVVIFPAFAQTFIAQGEYKKKECMKKISEFYDANAMMKLENFRERV